MQERVALVHGTLTIEPHAGGGTVIQVKLPALRREPIAPVQLRAASGG
jgi:nitrate/nitrite-specific signal transduction histidine kinase